LYDGTCDGDSGQKAELGENFTSPAEREDEAPFCGDPLEFISN